MIRFPDRVRNWLFVVDRKHRTNHTACSDRYNIDEYPFLSNVNSPISEQLNIFLRGDFGTQNQVKVGKPSQQGGRGSQILPGFPNFEAGKWFS